MRVFAVAVLLVACGSNPLKEDAVDGGNGGTGSVPRCANGPTSADVCTDGPGHGEPAAAIAVGSVRATLVNADGTPIPDLMVFLCGTLVCSLPEYTDSDGNVSIGFSDAMVKPAFKYGDGRGYGRFAALVQESTSETDLGTVGTPRLPETGSCLEPGQTAESGGVRLSLAADSSVEVLPIDYPEPDQRTFRAAELPIALVPAGLDGGEGLDAIFALAPTGAVVCPPATLELPNAPGYNPGTLVDILVHGVDIDEQWAPYGGWTEVATGRVDETGDRIETTEGGVPMLSNVGVRAR